MLTWPIGVGCWLASLRAAITRRPIVLVRVALDRDGAIREMHFAEG